MRSFVPLLLFALACRSNGYISRQEVAEYPDNVAEALNQNSAVNTISQEVGTKVARTAVHETPTESIPAYGEERTGVEYYQDAEIYAPPNHRVYVRPEAYVYAREPVTPNPQRAYSLERDAVVLARPNAVYEAPEGYAHSGYVRPVYVYAAAEGHSRPETSYYYPNVNREEIPPVQPPKVYSPVVYYYPASQPHNNQVQAQKVYVYPSVQEVRMKDRLSTEEVRKNYNRENAAPVMPEKYKSDPVQYRPVEPALNTQHETAFTVNAVTDTPEVRAAKAQHFAAIREASLRAKGLVAGAGAGAEKKSDKPSARYDNKPGAPLNPDGTVADTAEIKAAKEFHFAALKEAALLANSGPQTAQDDGQYTEQDDGSTGDAQQVAS